MNTTAVGDLTGAMWGTLAGMLFLMPMVGTALGAASGALAGKLSDAGIDDQFMREAANALQPGSAGLFLLIHKMTTDKVLDDLRGVGGTVLRTSFDRAHEAAARCFGGPRRRGFFGLDPSGSARLNATAGQGRTAEAFRCRGRAPMHLPAVRYPR